MPTKKLLAIITSLIISQAFAQERTYVLDSPKNQITNANKKRIFSGVLEDFIVNPHRTINQWNPAVAITDNGSFMVFWQDYRNHEFAGDIYGQYFSSSGAASGTNFRINDDPEIFCNSPTAGLDGAGNFVVIWVGYDDIYGQRYNSTGGSLGTNFKINEVSSNVKGDASLDISFATNGDFVVVWEDKRNTIAVKDVYGQLYNSSGAPLGANFKINDDPSGNSSHTFPSTVFNGNGNFMIVWSDGRSGSGIYGQIYEGLATAVGSNFKIDEGVGNSPRSPGVWVGTNSNYIVRWSDRRSGNLEIYGQRFTGAGIAIGNNFQVNIPASLDRGVISVNGSNDYLAYWAEYQNNNSDLYVQLYDSSGTALSEAVVVNDDTVDTFQSSRRISFDSRGNFAVVWSDQRNGEDDIYGQLFDSSVNAVGANFKATDETIVVDTTQQYSPAISVDSNGRFAVAWKDPSQILSRHYARSGNAIENIYVWNSDNGSAPDIALLDAENNYVVVWQDKRNGNYDISGVRDNYCKCFLDDFVVNDDTDNRFQGVPAVGVNGSDTFVIVWEDERNGHFDIYGQGYEIRNPLDYSTPLGVNFKVNDDTRNTQQRNPAIAMNKSGSFVVVWDDTRDGNSDIYGQRYAESGTALGANFKVNDDTGLSSQFSPAVGMDNNANYVVVWEDIRNSNSDIYGQRYSNFGLALGDNFQVNDDIGTSSQSSPTIGVDSDGNFVVVWQDNRNGNLDIYAQKYRSNGTTSGPNYQVNNDTGVATQRHPDVWFADGLVYYTWEDNRIPVAFDIFARVDNFDAPPSTPDNLSALVGDGQVTLSWDANMEPDFLRYRIYADISSNPTTVIDSLDGAANTSTTITDLNNGTIHFFRITAVDAALQESSFSNQVSVIPMAPNSAPIVNNAIPDTTLLISGPNLTRDLDASPRVFFDTDGDNLVYMANSSDTSVAISQISGSVLTVSPVTGGRVTIIVKANDGRGGSDSTTFIVTVVSEIDLHPTVSHVQLLPATPLEDQQLIIEANVSDDRALTGVRLFYRSGGETEFLDNLMNEDSGLYRTTIPATDVTTRGLEYYIEATDSRSQTTREPMSGISAVRVRTNNLESSVLRNGSEQNAYQMISIPVEASDQNPGAILEDDLGSYTNTKWRLYEIDRNEQKVEFPDISAMPPGRAFWLIVRDTGQRFGTGSALSNQSDETFQINLHSGWNLIGNPFNFTLPIENLSLSDSQQVVLRTYNLGWQSDAVSAIEPFEGYAIFNNSQASTQLLADPRVSLGSTQKKTTTANNRKNPLWAIRIKARCQDARDNDNVAGFALDVLDDFDESDWPEPPVIGEFVSVYFPHPEWNTLSKRYCTDIRSRNIDGAKWELGIVTNIRDVVNLVLDGITEVPDEYEVWLLDETLGVSQNMRTNNRYSLVASVQHPKRLQLLVGKGHFIDENLKSLYMPQDFELSQNFPNPFNPTTTIRYGLPGKDRVTLVIFNILGEEVVTLVKDVQKDVGYYVAVWDGRDLAGQSVSTGLYFYRLTSKNYSITKKMTLLR